MYATASCGRGGDELVLGGVKPVDLAVSGYILRLRAALTLRLAVAVGAAKLEGCEGRSCSSAAI